jgi:transcriptional regulator PpsR
MSRQAKSPADLGALSDLAPKMAETLAAAMGDVALVVDSNGVVQSAAFGGSDPMIANPGDWVGRKWADIVTSETRPKVQQLLREVSTAGVSRLRQVNHPAASGPDIPVAYSAVRLGEHGPLLVVGRDLRTISAIQRRLVETQQTMERDYWHRRQAETRYRLLFQIASDAVLIVDAGTLRIVEANAAAGQLFGAPPDKVTGKPIGAWFERAALGALEEKLASARITGRAVEAMAPLTGGHGEVRLNATPFRSEGSTLLLVRAHSQDVHENEAANTALPLAEFIERTPDGVVVTDSDGVVMSANPAFLELAQLANEELARGRSLGDWVGRPGGDLSMIIGIVRKHGVARPLVTALRDQHDQSIEIELSAAAISHGERECIGFTLRSIERRMMVATRGVQDLATAVEQLTALVGRVSLPDLVRDTTDLVEHHLIKAALELTGDNRTSAAEILGLSRQSLYVKLRRHGLQTDEGEDESNPLAHSKTT